MILGTRVGESKNAIPNVRRVDDTLRFDALTDSWYRGMELAEPSPVYGAPIRLIDLEESLASLWDDGHYPQTIVLSRDMYEHVKRLTEIV